MSPHEHRSPGRRATPGASSAFGVAAAVADLTTAAALPTSPLPPRVRERLGTHAMVRHLSQSSAPGGARDALRPCSQEVSR
jgi:hypothetical protein